MTFSQLLDDVRIQYLTQFRKRISELTSTGKRAIAEAAFRDERGAVVGEGALNLPLRGDAFLFADGQQPESVHITSEAMLPFEPITFEWAGSLPIRVAPFHWDACHVLATGIPESTDWSHVRHWFAKWFDSEDTRHPDEQGFCGVVHFLSDPIHQSSATVFQVDFGSAPVAAFEELLDALRDSGSVRVEIGVSG